MRTQHGSGRTSSVWTEHVQVFEFLRGVEAHTRIRRDFSDWPVSRPAPGFEYVVVGIRVANGDESVEQEFSAIKFPHTSFGLTGTENVLYDSAKAISYIPIWWGVTEATLPPGTSIDLWIAYVVPTHEERLMLRFDAGAPFDTRFIFPTPPPDPRFIALEEDAGIADTDIEPPQPTRNGLLAADPVALVETVATAVFEVQNRRRQTGRVGFRDCFNWVVSSGGNGVCGG